MYMILTAIALQAANPAPAPTAIPSACPPLPAALLAWNKAKPLASDFAIGEAVDLRAVTVATVKLAVQPSKPLTGAYLAVGGFEVTKAGRYAVAAGGAKTKLRPLWLDVAGADNKPLASVAHGHGSACTSITKIVEFDLKPGKYTFLATGLAITEPVRVLVTPRP